LDEFVNVFEYKRGTIFSKVN